MMVNFHTIVLDGSGSLADSGHALELAQRSQLAVGQAACTSGAGQRCHRLPCTAAALSHAQVFTPTFGLEHCTMVVDDYWT